MARPQPSLDLLTLANGLALLVVVGGVAVNVARPLAPDLGPPPDPARWFDPSHLALAEAYRRPLYVVALLGLLVRVAVPLAVAFTGSGRGLARRVVGAIGAERPARAGTALVLLVVVAADVAVLPLAWWAGYVHEGAWGFRTQGPGGWAYDWLVAKGQMWLAAGVVALAGFSLAGRLTRAWPPVAGVLAGVLAVGVVYVGPLVLEPLVFRTAPLSAGETRAAVEDVVARAGLTADAVVVADASRRTTKRNAYVSGLGRTRRVVLYDTLVDNHPPDEVAMVLAHEIGHHVNADLPRGAAAAAAGLVVTAYLLAGIARRRAAAGRQRSFADPEAAPVLVAVVVLAAVASAPLQMHASRQAEAAADLAALELTGDPETFLSMQEGLARSALSGPLPPRWVRVLWATHPPVAARMGMAEWWDSR